MLSAITAKLAMDVVRLKSKRAVAGYSPGFYKALHNLCAVDFTECSTSRSKGRKYLNCEQLSPENDVYLVDRLVSYRSLKVC